MHGLSPARAALRVLTGAGGGTPAQSALRARIRVHVEDRLRGGALGTAVLTKLRDDPGDASTAIAVPVVADEIARDPAFGDTLTDLLEQLLGGAAAVAAYGVVPGTGATGSAGVSGVPGRPTVLVIWLTSLLMALFGLIRGLFLLRGPSSVLVYLGTALSLGVVVVLLLAAQAGQIPGVRI
ncbi:hypothetical protein ACFY0N_06615 [Streptomyces vinaceus]|uniref:hypothetical protein n=1 Tax=Streptomyces vinaceus TaxID=1960 RepID=UPI0036AC2649